MGTSRLKNRRRNDQGAKWARIVIAILATVGVIDTGSITFSRWGLLGNFSCPGTAEGCDQVLNSPWGTLLQTSSFSIPLSLFGLISYLAIISMSIVTFLPSISNKKVNVPRKSWWALFTTSLSMSVFSLILLGIMIFKIKAFCLFCVISATISIIIFILSCIGGDWDEPRDLVMNGIIIAIVVLLGGMIWSSNIDPVQSEIAINNQLSPPIVKNKSTNDQISLAKHLKSSGAVMYSAYWCPHCHDQKELFGYEATRELIIIECAEDGLNNQSELCSQKGITGYPSWEIKKRIDSGVKSLEDLANISGYLGSRRNLD